MLCAASIAQQAPYSTHDWTVSSQPAGEEAFQEVWADVKTPGDGFQYSVGSIEVRLTGPGALFSGASASHPTQVSDIVLQTPDKRQVVMLQLTRTSDQSIERQRYFYGTSTDPLRATNARGISVWAAENRANTRIAICGETYDESLPLSQGSFLAANSLAPTGYIAVFDGLGTLLWTHHVYGTNAVQSCAITDVSIRVDAENREIVTYCGISSHGVPASATPLSPVAPFLAVPGESGGATDQGLLQWDGIVGRVSKTGAANPVVEFHSIVGGPEQDGLFGIAELEADRFVVVGGTIRVDEEPHPSGTAFPGLGGLTSPYRIGVALVFDKATGSWVRESTMRLGNTGSVWTLARDVHVMRDHMPAVVGITPDPRNMVAVVGSTSDPAMFPAVPALPVTPVMQGPTDGFLSVFVDRVLTNALWYRAGTYHGGPDNDGLTGVQGWSEYPDHLAVTGFTEGFSGTAFGPTFGSLDIGVESYFVSAWNFLSGSDVEIHSLHRARIGSGGLDRPAAMGYRNAIHAGLDFNTGPLGEAAGGGIAVDERSRINIVGSTAANSFYVLGGRSHDAAEDAVRTVLDMVPLGVGRTDGTGDQGSFPNIPFVLPGGFSGGTTPSCALSRFGKRIGDPAPAVPRILLEYEGPQPSIGVSGTLIVSRPVSSGLPTTDVGFAAFQFDIPGTTSGAPAPVQLPGGQELYITNSSAVATAVGFIQPNHPLIYPLLPFPAPPAGYTSVLTVQIGCWIPSGIPGGFGSPCPGTTDQAYSPAMWFQY